MYIQPSSIILLNLLFKNIALRLHVVQRSTLIIGELYYMSQFLYSPRFMTLYINIQDSSHL